MLLKRPVCGALLQQSAWTNTVGNSVLSWGLFVNTTPPVQLRGRPCHQAGSEEAESSTGSHVIRQQAFR